MDQPSSMLIDAELAAFMESAVMIIIGTCDNDRMPRIARAAGAMVDLPNGLVDLIVSGWQWPRTVADIRRNGAVSVTFARPSDYVSYQVKGHATICSATADRKAIAKHYIAAMTAALVAQGLDPAVTVPWLVDREPLVIRLAVETVFVQTPGEGAGRMREAMP